MDNTIKFRRAGILLAYPMAYAYVRLVFFGMFSQWGTALGLTAMSVIFIIVNELVRRGRRPFARRFKGETVFWYVMMVLAAFTAPFGANVVLSVFAVHLCAVYSVLVSNDLLLGNKTGGFILADLIHGSHVKSFAGFPNFVTDWASFKKTGNKKHMSAAVILLGIGFVAIMSVFFIVSLVFIAVRERRVGNNISSGLVKGRKVPCIVTCISAGFFVLLYILFFAKRTAYFLGGFTGEVPDGQLVSYFARDGFFELVGIMAVNMCVYLTIYLFEKRNPGGRTSVPGRIMVTLLMIESIVFAVIAMSKLWLYFSIFGYTPKRMLAMWGTLALGCAALLSIFTVNRGRSHFRAGVFFTASSYIAVCILSWVLSSM